MAAPQIAGVAVLMLDARSTATPLQIKNCLSATAIDKGNINKDCLWGWGRVDAYAAVQQVIRIPTSRRHLMVLVAVRALVVVWVLCF